MWWIMVVLTSYKFFLLRFVETLIIIHVLSNHRFNTVCTHPCQNFLPIASMKVHSKMELPSMKGNHPALIFLGLFQIDPCSFMSRYKNLCSKFSGCFCLFSIFNMENQAKSCTASAYPFSFLSQTYLQTVLSLKTLFI